MSARSWAERLRVPVLGSGPAWVRPVHVGVTRLAAALYLWNLALSGFGNTYYAAAALAASKD